MNVNELADELEKASTRAEDHGTIAKRNRQAATMLRQQQAEIEALKHHRNKLETLAEKMLQGSGEIE